MILITGATGFLGKEVLGRLLVRGATDKIFTLVRKTKEREAQSELEIQREILLSIFPEEEASKYQDKLQVIFGDIKEENFGIGLGSFQELAAKTDAVYHLAAVTNLGSSLIEARENNLQGTLNVLSFCHASKENQARKSPIKLFHVSTAYVAGTKTGVFTPEDLDISVKFKNGYEQSKAEAEAAVRGSGLDFMIFRPSMIVGSSYTGKTSAFNIIYLPAKLVAKGLFKALPAIGSTPVDLIPVDYVADAIVEISLNQLSTNERNFHLTVGVNRESSPIEIMECLFDVLKDHKKVSQIATQLLPLVPEDLVYKAASGFSSAFIEVEKIISKRLPILQQIFPLVPYMTSNPRFDSSATEKVLKSTKIKAPQFRDYGEKIFNYCLDTNWGKKAWSNPRNLKEWWQNPTN